MTDYKRVANWLSAPWTAGERAELRQELGAIDDDYQSRGVFTSGARLRDVVRAEARLRRRRVRLRTLGLLALLVTGASFVSAFTDNRIVEVVQLAAIGTAAPVALLLGLRR